MTAAAVTVGWALAAATAPLWAAAAEELAAAVYAVGSLVCHQRPDRSFHLGVVQLPVCARCLGLYAGGAVGLVAWAIVARRRTGPWPAARAVRLLAIAALPTLATVLSATAGIADPSNVWRAALALPLGAATGIVAGAVLTDHLK